MTRLTLVVDERELSAIRAALLLLQEQMGALPEDLADMLCEHGPAMTEKQVGALVQRLAVDENARGQPDEWRARSGVQNKVRQATTASAEA